MNEEDVKRKLGTRGGQLLIAAVAAFGMDLDDFVIKDREVIPRMVAPRITQQVIEEAKNRRARRNAKRLARSKK